MSMIFVGKIIESLKSWLGLNNQNHLKQEEIYKFANNAISRAECGFYFLKQCLQKIHTGGTMAYSRSIYILFSYNFELVLKTLFILTKIGCGVSKEKLKQELQAISHNFEKCFKKIPSSILKDIGIKSVKKTSNKNFVEYTVKVSDSDVKTIIFQEFSDVRYDFLDNKFRSPNYAESERMKKETETLLEVVKKIKEKIPNLNYYEKEYKEWHKKFQQNNPHLFN